MTTCLNLRKAHQVREMGRIWLSCGRSGGRRAIHDDRNTRLIKREGKARMGLAAGVPELGLWTSAWPCGRTTAREVSEGGLSEAFGRASEGPLPLRPESSKSLLANEVRILQSHPQILTVI
jgi:hypothetical protein